MINRLTRGHAGVRVAPALAWLAICAATSPPLFAQDMLWSDEFDSGSVPNPAVWSYDRGDWGWGNREL